MSKMRYFSNKVSKIAKPGVSPPPARPLKAGCTTFQCRL